MDSSVETLGEALQDLAEWSIGRGVETSVGSEWGTGRDLEEA